MFKIPPPFAHLPLVSALPAIAERLAQGGNLLLTAPTGTGKSSLLPWLLAANSKRVAVLQPRRIAALSLAQFLARAYDEEPGSTVGYRFRLESRAGASTRVLFQTYGSFVQAVLHRQDAPWDWVVFDEFHERRAEMDLLLAYLLQWQKAQPDKAPRLAVLSAELNRETLEKLLGIPCLRIENPGFPVQIVHQESKVSEQLDSQVVRAVRNLRANNVWNTTLVFLPGKGEIDNCHRAVREALGPECPDLLNLFGGQDIQEQRRIFADTSAPRIIFTTNIAETSLTVPQVSAVIDSGYERASDYNANQDLRVLRLARISLQNAVQRTGRAGRTRAGICIRLWGEREENGFPREVIPEVLRSKPDLLLLHRAALAHQIALPSQAIVLPTEPPAALVESALQELRRLGLMDNEDRITPQGLAALQVPVQSVELAALLTTTEQAPDLLLACAVVLDAGSENGPAAREARNLLEMAQELLDGARGQPREWPQLLTRLRDWRKRCAARCEKKSLENPRLETLRALLATFPGALAIQDGAGKAYKLNDQISLVLSAAQTGNADAILAFALLRSGSQKTQQVRASLFAPVPAELLHRAEATEHYELVWRSGQERYTGLRIRTANDRELERRELVPQECSPAELKELSALTAPTWLERFTREDLSHRWRTEAVETLLAKMHLAATTFPEYNFPLWEDDDWDLVMEEFVSGVFLLRDLEENRFRRLVEDYFGRPMLGWLAQTFPDHYKLSNGKSARYTYHTDGMVELSARIADFLGMQGEHRIAEGRVKVRYDILAPNYRTVQKTWDLSGFWKNTYAEVRKELRGRYPRHPWPEVAP